MNKMNAVQSPSPINFSINGADGMPPFNGGYIVINLDGEELYIVSVPSMIWGTERYRDSIVDNFEQLDDENGNVFNVSVYSSKVGVDWEIDVITEDETLEDRISVEYHANEY